MRLLGKKRILALIIIVVFGMLTGCFEKKTDVELDGLPQLEKLEPVTLTFMMYGQENQDTKEVLNKVAEESRLNIKLDFKWMNMEYFETIKKLVASGDNFDAFVCGKPSATQISFVDMFRNGEIKDITELLPQYAPAINRQYSEDDLESVKVDGKLAALPSLYPQSMNNIVVEVRDDLMNKYNIKPIRTLSDYDNFLRTIKEKEPEIVPGINAFYNSFRYFANANGYVIFDEELRLVYKWEDSEMKLIPWEQTAAFREVVSYVDNWNKSGYLTNVYSPNGREFNRQIHSAASNMSYAHNHSEGVKEVEANINGKIEKLPFYAYTLYPNEKVQRINPINNIYSMSGIAFNSKSSNTERALMLLNWIQSSQENYDLMVYGIKDKHYKLSGERILIENENSIMNNPYFNYYCQAFENIAFSRNYTYAGEETEDDLTNWKQEYSDYIFNNTLCPPHTGFYPDLRNIQEKAAARADMYNDLIDRGFYQNGFDPANTDNVIKQLKDAGTDTVIHELQRQLDKWRAENKKD